MQKFLIAVSALALSTSAAYAQGTKAPEPPAKDKNGNVEQSLDKAGEAIEDGARTVGNALESAGETVARKAEEWTNGLREVEQNGVVINTPEKNMYSARALIGAEIYGPADQMVARVDDIWITKEGKVEAILADRGGFLGLGEQNVALRSGKVTFVRDGSGNVIGSTELTDKQLDDIADTRYDANIEYRPSTDDYSGLAVDENVIGHSVVSSTGEDIAFVRDVLISRDGSATHLVLVRGGLLGLGGDLVAVPLESLQFEQGDGEGSIVLQLSEAELNEKNVFRYYSLSEHQI